MTRRNVTETRESQLTSFELQEEVSSPRYLIRDLAILTLPFSIFIGQIRRHREGRLENIAREYAISVGFEAVKLSAYAGIAWGLYVLWSH